MGVIKDVVAMKKLEDLVVVKPAKSALPDLTTGKIEAAIPLLREVEKNNGHLAIASVVGLTQAQVAEIHVAMKEQINALTVSTK